MILFCEKNISQNNLMDFSKLLHNSDLGNRTHLPQNAPNRSESARNGIAGQQSTHIACTNIITEEKNNSQNNFMDFSKLLHPDHKTYPSQNTSNGSESTRNEFSDKNAIPTSRAITVSTKIKKFIKKLLPKAGNLLASLKSEHRAYLPQKASDGSESARNRFPNNNSTQTTYHTNFLRKKNVSKKYSQNIKNNSEKITVNVKNITLTNAKGKTENKPYFSQKVFTKEITDTNGTNDKNEDASNNAVQINDDESNDDTPKYFVNLPDSLNPENRTHLPQKASNGSESARNGFPDKNSTPMACTPNFSTKMFLPPQPNQNFCSHENLNDIGSLKNLESQAKTANRPYLSQALQINSCSAPNDGRLVKWRCFLSS